MRPPLRQRISWWFNLVLAAAAVLLIVLPRAGSRSSRPIVSTSSPPPAPTPATPAKGPVTAFPASASPREQRRALIDELRAMGVPNAVLARIVLADLDAAATKYSAAVAIKTRGNPDTMAALQIEVDRNRDAEMRAALGEEGFREWDHQNMLREMNRGNVPWTAAETDAGYNLWKQLQLQQLDLREAQLKGTMDSSEVSAALEKANAEYTAQMKTLLGDDRYAPALEGARDATDRSDVRDDASAPARKQQDADYANMKKHQDLWGLDDATIDSVYGALADYQKGVADYEASIRTLEGQGQTIDRAAADEKLREFARQTEQSVRNSLGDERFNQLRRNGIFNSLAEPPHYARPNDNIDRTNTVSIR